LAVDSRDMVEGRPRGGTGRGAPQGARTLTAILPNGRTIWFRVDQPLATVVEVHQLGQAAEHNARWSRAGAQSQSEAIARLARTVVADTERLSEAKRDRSHALRRRLARAHRRRARKLAKAREEFRARLERQIGIERESIKRLRRRDLWDQILIASSLPLFAAYGEPGRPFGANNITLMLSLFIWLVGDDVVDALFGSEEKSAYPVRNTDAWSYVAPIGNALAGWWLLDDRQHERLVSGPLVVPHDPFEFTVSGAEFTYVYTGRLELRAFIAIDHFADFQSFANLPVVASVASFTRSADGIANNARITGLVASVSGGELLVTVTAVAAAPDPLAPAPQILDAPIQVAWVVDTAKPGTDIASS
jgi:hypothetical protein